MTPQEIFDKMLSDIRAQGCAAMTKAGGCAYTNEDGKHCAAYNFLTEKGKAVNPVCVWSSVKMEHKLREVREHDDLIRNLQAVHDNAGRYALNLRGISQEANAYFMQLFEKGMERFTREWPGNQHNLVYTPPVS